MSNTVRLLIARTGTAHVSHPDRPDYFLCGAGGRHGAPVTIGTRECGEDEFRRAVHGCKSCKRGLDKMNMDAIVKAVHATPVADKPAAPILGTARVVAHPVTLHATVEVVRELPRHFEVRVISGVGGWSAPGKVFYAGKGTLVDFVPAVPVAAPTAPEVEPAEPKSITDGVEPITEPMDAEDCMNVLVARQQAWMQAHPQVRLPALYEWFILPGEEALVRLPERTPAEKPARKPRTYKSAAALRAERDALTGRMARVAGAGDVPDRAAANLSPNARSRAARTAGRRRFERMDRDLATYAELQRRVTALNGRIASAEARERRQMEQTER